MKTDTLLSITAHMKKFLAQELHMQEDEISEDMQFIDLGLDSITGVTWVRKINEKYKLTIEATKVYGYPTLNEFSKYVLNEAEKHGTIVDEPNTIIKEATPKNISKDLPIDLPVYTPKTSLIDSMSVVKKLTSWRKQTKSGIIATASSQLHPIAIIGMAGQFPKATNLEAYWNNISQGKDCITKVSETRWDLNTYYREGDPVPGKTNCQWLGSLEEYDLFDPLFFNIAPAEAESMDPQQRMFLQACWHTIEDAGYDAKILSGSKCGVFVGCATGDYQFLSRDLQITAKGFTGNANSILAARISYFLNLQGPCITIDSACSSSLVAISTACESLNSGNSDIALTGGVCIITTPDLHIKSSQTGMLSPDGKCYTFDNRANGFVPGEGVGVMMLKRLTDAQKDNDRILGVIQGWGINQDGKTNGITAPSPESQKRLMQDVYDKFNIDPAQIHLIEAHGTGTKLGDPIEVSALIESFSKYTTKKGYCAIGSVKSNIGHCLAAAGAASVIKVVLALKNRQLPPTINFEQLNEHINLKDSPFYVNDQLKKWNGSGSERYQAAVSGFGFSGTNAHIVIAEYLPHAVAAKSVSQNSKVIIPLSARNTERLNQKAYELLDYIRNDHQSINLNEMAYTLQVGREAMEDRLGFLVNTVEELVGKLQAYINGDKNIEETYQGQVNRNKESLRILSRDHDVQETLINKWISNKQPSKLLDLWVKGLDFDWNRLYGHTKPKRINLPLYPFAKERYWVEYEYKMLQTSNAEIPVVIHPLLHTNTSNFSQQSYSSSFSGEEFFLRDHQIQISAEEPILEKVLPGVAYLEMARAAIENAMSLNPESNRLELHNIIWVRPVVVTLKRKISIVLVANDNNHVDFEIYSFDNGLKVEHCQGQAILKNQHTRAQIDIEHLTHEMNNGRMDADSAYVLLRKMGLYYGPAHQGINIIYQGAKQVLAQLQLPEVFNKTKGVNEFVLHPCIMDSALQAAIGFTEDLNQLSNQPSLPFALETLRIFSPCQNTMYSWVRYAPGNKSEGKLSKLDIDLIDQDGNICVQMQGLTSRILDSEIKQIHPKTTNNLISDKISIKENESSFDVTFYETLIKNVLNNEVSIDEAVEIA